MLESVKELGLVLVQVTVREMVKVKDLAMGWVLVMGLVPEPGRVMAKQPLVW
ncbi:MAG: hypothetical protein Q8R07_02645 [Candidatus Uhrbacteria bacterium]|nr:hypothetical protein [Candidatus Uhrbacteria bacterium]